ncbi:MAG TPA: hypothetical protein VFL53_12210 [Pseudolabrys sp.]|nr:hypothetical protein [Pseudolabrys sp.]
MTEALVYAFHDDRLYTFERTARYSASKFGGPLCVKILGRSFGPKPLHLIASLGGWHIPSLNDHQLVELPLVYGLNYDGCRIDYRVSFGHTIELLDMQPAESSDDWPYPYFPPLLPYVPLRLEDTCRRTSYGAFASRFPNMPAQQPAELIVAVPPPATIGVSLWGGADADDVTIMFACDLKKKRVSACNVTS